MIPPYFTNLFKKVFYIIPGLILGFIFYFRLSIKLPHDIVFTTNYIYLAGILAIIFGHFIRFCIYYTNHLKGQIPVKINSKKDRASNPEHIKREPETLKKIWVDFFKLLATSIRENYNTLWQNFFVAFLDKFNLSFFMLRIIRFLHNHPTKTLHYVLYLGLYLLPKTIVLLALMVDVFIFQKIEYFYLCAPLILVERFYNTLFDFLVWFLQGYLDGLVNNLQVEPGKFVDSQGNTIENKIHIEDDIVYEYNVIITFHPDYPKPHFIKNLRDYYENYLLPMRNIPFFRGGLLKTNTLLKRKETDLIFAYLYFSTWVTVLSLMLNYTLINQTLLV